MFNLPADGNYKSIITDYDLEQSTDCENRGCGAATDDDYCRCGTIDGIEIKNNLANCIEFFENTYDGPKDTLEEALAFWFLKLHFKHFEWGYNSSGGYYGEELDGISLYSSGGFYEQGAHFEKLSSTEKIHYLLTKEYGSVLPNVAAVKRWVCSPVFTSDVHNSLNKNFNDEVLKSYQTYFERIIRNDLKRKAFQEHVRVAAPLCMTTDGRNFDVVDGRHRCEAFHTTYDYLEKETKKKYVKKDFVPVYMWVIHPVVESK